MARRVESSPRVSAGSSSDSGWRTSLRYPRWSAKPTSAEITLFDALLIFAGWSARAPEKYRSRCSESRWKTSRLRSGRRLAARAYTVSSLASSSTTGCGAARERSEVAPCSAAGVSRQPAARSVRTVAKTMCFMMTPEIPEPRDQVPELDALLLSQDLVQGPPLRQFIHQLVQVSDVAHERIVDLLDSDAADDAGDLARIWIERRRFAKKGLEVRLSFNLLPERSGIVAREPADDFVHILPLAPFGFGFLYVVGIYAGEGSGEDSMLLHGSLGK